MQIANFTSSTNGNPDSQKSQTQNFSNQAQLSVDGNLLLTQFVLHLAQTKKTTETLRLEERGKYRENQGRNNKIAGAFSKTPISKKELEEFKATRKFTHQPSPEERASKADSPKPIAEKIPEKSQPEITLKKLSPEELKKYIESQKEVYKISGAKIFGVEGEIEGIDFSGMDLSAFNLNNLIFKNSNFSGAKIPSMTSVTFDNNCNLEGSDWSKTTQNNVQFGSYFYKKNVENLVELIDQFQLSINNISTFDDYEVIKRLRLDGAQKSAQEIQQSIDLTSKEIQKPQILKVTNANFSGVKFANFFAYDSDFSGSDFTNASLRINQGGRDKDTTLYAPSVRGIDFTGATLEFFDNRGVLTGQALGANSLNLDSMDEGLHGLIANSGISSQEFYEKMTSKKEIVIKINADTVNIPKGLQFQSISDKVSTSSKLSPEKIDEIQRETVKIGNEYFGRYNIKFVTPEMLKDDAVDFTLHVNLVDGIGSARADGSNLFGLGAKESFIAIDEAELGKSFTSILSHEFGHIFLFQHPMGHADLEAPSHMSYLLPMAQRPDNQNQLVANNIIPLIGFTATDQNLFEQYMKIFGREPQIKQDLVSELDLETLGALSSYNPDAKFDNIVKISPEIFDKNFRIVLMSANDALAYCKTANLYQCESSKTMDGAHAIMLMSQDTGIVNSMMILAGENPKIKIGENELKDVKELVNKDGFSILGLNQNREIIFDKYSKIGEADSRILTESKLLNDDKISSAEKIASANSDDAHKAPNEDSLASKIANYLGIAVAIFATGALSYANRNRLSGLMTRDNLGISAKQVVDLESSKDM